jgi:hypothetical protein
VSDEFLLQEWEVWHTYAMVLSDTVPDVEAAARRMVAAGVLASATTREGYTAWLGPTGHLRSGTTFVTLAANGLADVRLPLRIDGRYAAQSAWQAAWFRYAEQKLFTPFANMPPRYVRGLMGACRLVDTENGHSYQVYPTLVLYETGVAVVSLRILSARPWSAEEFTRRIFGLRQTWFEDIWVPPAVLRAAAAATLGWHEHGGGLGAGWRALQHLHAVDEIVRASTEAAAEPPDPEGFAFEAAPLRVLAASDEPVQLRLTDLGRCLVTAAMYAASGPREGLAVLRGQVPLTTIDFPFVGRTHVYLFRHSDQRPSAQENEAAHGDVFGRIVAGLPEHVPEVARSMLSPSARRMGDMSWYMTPVASLTVWSADGIRQQDDEARIREPNRGHLVYEQHARAELLEYGHALRTRLARLALRSDVGPQSTASVLRAQRALVQLDASMDIASPLAEVRQYLLTHWETLGASELRSRTREALAIRRDEAALWDGTRQARWTTVLAVVFGFLAIPPLASEVLGPLWALLGWPPVDVGPARDLALVLVAAAIVAAALLGARIWIGWAPRRTRSALPPATPESDEWTPV